MSSTWWELVLTGLIGGLGSSLLNAVATALRTTKTETTARRAAFLEAQIQKVYWPVYLEISASRRLLELSARYRTTWERELHRREEAMRNRLEQSEVDSITEEVTSLQNMMSSLHQIMTRKFNDVAQVFHQNAAYIDQSDLPLVLGMVESATRFNLEFSLDPYEMKISPRLHDLVDEGGEDYRARAAAIDQFEKRLFAKNAELEELRGLKVSRNKKRSSPWWGRFFPRRQLDRKQAA